MTSTIIPIILITIAEIIFWIKGNSKELWQINWSPFRWWLTISLLTNYLTLHGWWLLLKTHGVWKGGVIWGVISVIITCILNSIFFEFDIKGVIALGLTAIALIII